MIKIACDSGAVANLEDLHDFQNEMKTLSTANYLKLRNEIEETGFSFAVHVWANSEDKKLYILDGHQRVACLRRMAAEGAHEEILVPIVRVEAVDYREAKRKVMAAASQFGEFQIEGLMKTMGEAALEPLKASTMFDFPMIDILSGQKLELAYPEGPVEPRKIIQGDEEFSREVDEKNNYLVFLFDSKEEFDAACAKFQVKPVISMLSREYNEKMASRGIGRILPGDLLK